MTTSIETTSGKFFDFAAPTPEMVDFGDVAAALSKVCRFGGHASRFYSVAEHASHVYRIVRRQGGDPEMCLAALHHDSHEYVVGDTPSPLKQFLGARYRELVLEVDEAIATALGIDVALFKHPLIKAADELALRREAAALKVSRGVGPHWGYTEPCSDWSVIGYQPRIAEADFYGDHVIARAHRRVSA